jgi:hypothetical protein
MLPDGAEKQLEDWTIFFLNQTSFNTIAPVLALESPAEDGKPDMLYVLNLVRTKLDKAEKRLVAPLRTDAREALTLRTIQWCAREGHGDLHTASVHPDLQGLSSSPGRPRLIH